MGVDPVTASWLQAQYMIAGTTSDPVGAAWGDLAATSEIGSPIASKADALEEAARQHNFLLAAMVIDQVEVPGLQIGLIGKPLDLFADDGGYAAGARVFVIGVEEMDEVNRSRLTVLRRLT